MWSPPSRKHVRVTGTEEDNADVGGRWPPEPQTLHQAGQSTAVSVAIDCIMLIIPILFIALTAVAYKVDNKPVSEYGSVILAACKWGPTIFPIAFTAIAGKTVRRLAQRLVERGERIGILEQLVGSQSLAGTVTRMAELRSLHVLGMLVLSWWLLSPLGGQSALRLLSVEYEPIHNVQKVTYVNLNNRTNTPITKPDNKPIPAMMALFSAALLGAGKNQEEPVDIWGNPKIPFLDSLRDGGDGWQVVENASNIQYSSLSGNRLQGMCADCKATFPMEASYLNLMCRNAAHGLREEMLMDFLGDPFYGWSPSNRTYPFHSNDVFPVRSFLGTNHYFTPLGPEPGDFPTIFYATRGRYRVSDDPGHEYDSGVSVYNCTLTSPKVEVNITCDQGSCGVSHMRKSLRDHRPDNWTPFHDDPPEISRLLPFFSYAGNYDIFGHQTSPTDNFISGDFVTPFDPRDDYPEWKAVQDADISHRLTVALNSMRQITMSPFSIANGNTFKPLRCMPAGADSNSTRSELIDDCTNMQFAQAEVTRQRYVYKASRKWIGFMLCSSLGLLFLGIFNIFLKLTTTAPDVLGYVSSITRENRCIRLAAGGTGFDGIARARALRNMKLQVMDMRGYDSLGYIAVKNVDDARSGLPAAKLHKDRLYE